jgi:hypothetical protein
MGSAGARGMFHNIIDFFSQWFKFQHLHISIVDSLNLTLTEWKTKPKKRKWSQQVSSHLPQIKCSGKPVQCSELATPTRRGMDYVTQHEPCTIHPKPLVTQLWIERNWVTKITYSNESFTINNLDSDFKTGNLSFNPSYFPWD